MPSSITTLHELTLIKDSLFTVFSPAPYGEEYLYPALSEMLGEDAQSERGRRIILSVGKRLEREAQRTLVCKRGIGYRIARPEEHVHLSSRRQDRGRKQLNRGLRILHATPVHKLQPAERQRHDAFLAILRHQVDTFRSVKQHVEVAHAEVSALLEEKLADAMTRLQSLESRE